MRVDREGRKLNQGVAEPCSNSNRLARNWIFVLGCVVDVSLSRKSSRNLRDETNDTIFEQETRVSRSLCAPYSVYSMRCPAERGRVCDVYRTGSGLRRSIAVEGKQVNTRVGGFRVANQGFTVVCGHGNRTQRESASTKRERERGGGDETDSGGVSR